MTITEQLAQLDAFQRAVLAWSCDSKGGYNQAIGLLGMFLDDVYPALRAALAQEPTPIDIHQMRGNLHRTFNGGWDTDVTRRAFHHGMDTVCNVLESYQRGDSTNGILPVGGSPDPDPPNLWRDAALLKDRTRRALGVQG